MRHWLDRAAALQPERIAIEHESGRRISYRQLLADASAAADRLAADGLAAGERVALEDSDRLAFATQLHAVLRAGGCAVPIDARLAPGEQARRRSPGREHADTATLMFTSGTTAGPKPVALSGSNWQANAVGSALALGLDPAERWLCTMPLGHVGGLSILLRCTLYGSTVVLRERFDVPAIVEQLMDPAAAITLISVVPTMLGRLLDAGLQAPPTLRWALTSGAPTPPALLARARAASVPVAPSYGLTETCSQMVTFGLPLLDGGLRLLDGKRVLGVGGQPLPAGQRRSGRGEIVVRGPMVATGALAADGWLHTGDLGELDARGRLTVVGRKSETIISGGENVAPAEVEAVLLEHPAVAEAAVFGRPDPDWGEVVTAAVVLRDGESETAREVAIVIELKALAAARLAPFMAPKSVTIVATLPRTTSGKLIRERLR